jgi:hypothetical protein
MGIGKKTHFKILKMNTLQQEIEKLYSEQLTEWAQFGENVLHLNHVKIHSYDFGNYVIKTQYNPARIVSSNAKLDEKSIAARKCFLCPENRPAVQREVRLNERFIALVNPHPVLKYHFTIPLIQHRKQEILPYLRDMLDFAQALPDYIIFYNGPKAGASAPDHIHFQAVRKGQLPLESEYQKIEKKVFFSMVEDSNVKVSTLQDYGRHCTLIQSSGKEIVSFLFQQIYALLQSLSNTGEEPMMNVFTSYENGLWNLFIFPRKVHRPSQFFAEGEDYKMISPGAIDMAGVFVLPRKEDFESVSKEIILDVLGQVSLL